MLVSPAHAQVAGAAVPGGSAFLQFVPLVLIFVIMYLLLFRPQQQQMKRLRQAIDAVKKGDTVVTGGGLVAKVVRVDGDEVELELGPNTRVRAVKATLTEVRGARPAND